MSTQDLYKRLNVDRNATTEEIKRAYRTLARDYHPDRGGNAEQFKSIQEAHEILTDESRRKIYDMTGSTNNDTNVNMAAGGIPFSFMGGMGMPFGMPGVAFDFGEVLGGLFGGGGGGRPTRRGGKGPNKFHDISLKLTNFYNGGDIKLKFNQARRCIPCSATGAEAVESCGPCNGSGVRTHIRQIGPGMIAQSHGPCDICNGEGRRVLRTCRNCNGKRFVEKEKSLDIKIVPGMRVGETLSFSGECSDSLEYDSPGDVVLTLKQSDVGESELDEFIWVDDNLIIRKEITYAESILGFSRKLENHPNNSCPNISWTNGPLIHGAVLRVEGLGMPKKGGGFGSLLFQVCVQPPPVRKWTVDEYNQLIHLFGNVEVSSESYNAQLNSAMPQVTMKNIF